MKNIFLNIVDEHAPRRVMRVRNKPAPWLNSQLKEEMYERDWLKKKPQKRSGHMFGRHIKLKR